MDKKTIEFKKEIEDFLSTGEVSDDLLLVIQNAMMWLDDGRCDRQQAKKYIYDWYLTFVKNGRKFSKHEKKLFQLVQQERKSNVLGAIASSIMFMFRP
ncbi:hypothetical protein AALA52_03835 [Lactococcus ileimucosae]|uniref:Bacteriocin immunity protein n=1 Tax=Lactococcus ileimucosae TaxID=2941329 RepID=A0ABV4D3F9_9LACT